MNNKRQVLIVDDHSVVRRGLRQLVNEEPDLSAPWEAETAGEALHLVSQHLPDLVLVDVTLEGASGIELVKQLQAHHPEIPVLVISMHDEKLYAERALAAGARGYVMKRTPDREMLEAIRQVLSGRVYVSEKVRSRLFPLEAGFAPAEVSSPVERLSDRELEVFLLLGQGYAPRHIADELCVSVKTVESHRQHLKKKLNLESSAELTRYAIEWHKENAAT